MCKTLQWFCNCCYQNKRQKAYFETLKAVENDVQHRLDILAILRRLRSHGNCINFLLDAKTRNECTKIAGTRTPIETIEDTINNASRKKDWSRDEALTY